MMAGQDFRLVQLVLDTTHTSQYFSNFVTLDLDHSNIVAFFDLLEK